MAETIKSELSDINLLELELEEIAAARPELLVPPGLDASGDPWSWGAYSTFILVSVVDVIGRILVEAVIVEPKQFGDLRHQTQHDRFAVVADAQGAAFALLRASGGDPPDTEPETGSWAWAELWTRDVKTAAGFYEESLDYRAMHNPDAAVVRPVVLTAHGRPRATIVEIPWDDVEPNWVPYVSVDDAREALRRATAAGGSVLLTSDDVENEDGPFAALIADPTGGVFAIQQAGGAR